MERPYTFGKFIIDAILTVITSGLWLIWVFCREMRKNNRRSYRRENYRHPRGYCDH